MMIDHLDIGSLRRLLGPEWDERPLWDNLLLLAVCILLVLFAGCMSGLTLGLMSLDLVVRTH